MSLLGSRSSVLAVIPHFECPEPWLLNGLQSLFNQSRPPDAIVVLDDASSTPPLYVLREFPEVTLMVSPENVGQYCLMQQVIDQTDYDAYLLQDADDWSHAGRLQALMELAERTSAEVVGSAEMRENEDGSRTAVDYPFDVNCALRKNPGSFALLLCTALIGGAAIDRVGGLAGGMRICGDYDFVLRAPYEVTVRNSPEPLYSRRIHGQSLTASPATGFESDFRKTIHRMLIEKDIANARSLAAGLPPDLSPSAVSKGFGLEQIGGPSLRAASRGGLRTLSSFRARRADLRSW